MLDELLNILKTSFTLDGIVLERINGLHGHTLMFKVDINGYSIQSSCRFAGTKTATLSVNGELINETICVNLNIVYSYEVLFYQELARLYRSKHVLLDILIKYLLTIDSPLINYDNKSYREIEERIEEFDVIKNRKLDLISLEQLCNFYNVEFSLMFFQLQFTTIMKQESKHFKSTNLEFQC